MLLDNLDEYLSNPVLESLTEFDDEFDLEVGLESDSVDDLELTDEDIEAILDEDNEEFDDLDADFESAAYIEEEFESALESVLYDSADEVQNRSNRDRAKRRGDNASLSTDDTLTGGMEMFSDYDDYDYGYAMESDDFDDCDFEDDDFEEAEEGLFATKANKEAARGMDAKSLLELFVQKKGEGYFISDEELMKQQLESKGITEYNIVTVSDVIFAIVEDGAYYITKGRKVNKLKKSDMAKLQKAGARQLTKNERADNRQARRDARAAKKAAKRGDVPAEGEDDAEEGCASESWYDDYLYDYSDEY